MRLALIHSPLVGPSTWRAVANALEKLGAPACAADYGGVRGPDWYADASRRIASTLASCEKVVFALHSGAGGFAPALAAEFGDRSAGFLFVDAVMPYPGRSWLDTASPQLAAHLLAIAEDGVLPRWDAWFGRNPVDEMIDDPELRATFTAELPRLPLAYLEAVAPTSEAWRERPCAYLQLSGAYAREAEAAAALGWPVRREPLHHLAMLTHPDRVAAILRDMVCELSDA